VTMVAYENEERPELSLEEEESDETFSRIVAEPLDARCSVPCLGLRLLLYALRA
jgi:hypothetical protein